MRGVYGIERFVDDLTGLPLRERQAFSPTCNIAGFTSGYGGVHLAAESFEEIEQMDLRDLERWIESRKKTG